MATTTDPHEGVPLYGRVRVIKATNGANPGYFNGDVGTYIGKWEHPGSRLFRVHIPGRGDAHPMWRSEFEVIDDAET